MSEQPKSIWKRDILPEAGIFSWPGRFMRWFFTRRNLRRIIILLAWTATVAALFYAEEYWRGRRAWTQYRQDLERRGEQLDLEAFIPKPVPDEQNFAATPFVRSWFERTTNYTDPWNDDFAQADKLVLNQKLAESRRHFVDLTAWAAAFDAVHSAKSEPADEKAAFGARYGLKKGEVVPTRPGAHQEFSSIDRDLETRAQAAPAVLEGLKSSAAVLAELRAASARPVSRFPVVYNLDNPWAILLPHLAQLKGVCRRLELRACAELAAGQSAEALDDLTLMLYVADSVKGEPFLISYLVRLSCLKIATRTIWEGLAEHRWTDSQLRALQDRLAGYNLLSDLKQPLATERAAAILTVDLLTRGKYNLNNLGDSSNQQPETGSALPALVSKIIPSGWFYLERLNYCLSFDTLLNGTFDSATQRIWPDRIESNMREFERQLFGGRFGRDWNLLAGHRIITALLLPALANVTHKVANAQTTVNQAIIACALERYRLANGSFPEKLEAMTPQFMAPLPHDVINGEPFHYRRGEGNQFTLYSDGWNLRRNDQSLRKSLFDGKEGDWVWECPQNPSNQKAKPLE